MKKVCGVCSALMLIAALATLVSAQQNANRSSTAQTSAATTRARPLVLTETIPLEGVKGRFDHFASAGGRLFVAALGNDSVEVINTGGRTLAHTITGVPSPQGVAFSPEATPGGVRHQFWSYDRRASKRPRHG
jgi:YVTN family beta-propeller protein